MLFRSIEFQKKLGTGLFGGEGFIMQKLEGDGMAFVHSGGYVVEKELQCVEIELDPQEAVISEPGSFMMMTDGIQMETLFGDGTETGGLLGKLFSAGKRLLTGENLFMTVYTNTSYQKRQVTFAAPYSGKIIPLDLSDLGGKVICQKDSFLCAAKGVSVGIEF